MDCVIILSLGAKNKPKHSSWTFLAKMGFICLDTECSQGNKLSTELGKILSVQSPDCTCTLLLGTPQQLPLFPVCWSVRMWPSKVGCGFTDKVSYSSNLMPLNESICALAGPLGDATAIPIDCSCMRFRWFGSVPGWLLCSLVVRGGQPSPSWVRNEAWDSIVDGRKLREARERGEERNGPLPWQIRNGTLQCSLGFKSWLCPTGWERGGYMRILISQWHLDGTTFTLVLCSSTEACCSQSQGQVVVLLGNLQIALLTTSWIMSLDPIKIRKNKLDKRPKYHPYY